jgi:hypothetical protein
VKSLLYDWKRRPGGAGKCGAQLVGEAATATSSRDGGTHNIDQDGTAEVAEVQGKNERRSDVDASNAEYIIARISAGHFSNKETSETTGLVYAIDNIFFGIL